MDISIKKGDALERIMTVTLPANVLDDVIDKRARGFQKNAKINGFRPGKAPIEVIKQHYAASLEAEASQKVIEEHLFKALKDKEIEVAGFLSYAEPQSREAGEPFSFVTRFEVYPEFKFKELKRVKIEKPLAEITEADVDDALERLRGQHTSWQVVERVPQLKDQVVIDFKGYIDGEAFEGGTAENVTLELGSGKMIPGFEDGIVGQALESTENVTVTFPEEYHNKEYAGKEAVFEITLKSVSESALPALDEDFAKKLGIESGDMNDVRSDVQKNMTRELEDRLQRKLKDGVFEALRSKNDIELPTTLVEQEARSIMEDLLRRSGMKPEDMDLNGIPKDPFMEDAKKRVHTGLLIREAMKKYEISMDADSEAVRERVEDLASMYDDPKSVVEWYHADPKRLQDIRAWVLESQVVEALLAVAKVKEVSTTYRAVMELDATPNKA